MKKSIGFIIVSLIILSCGEANKKEQNLESTPENKETATEEKTVTKEVNNNTVLCKINGKDWQYTSSDGLVSRNSETEVRTATIMFKRKLDKGSESIQLEYDVDKNVLNTIWVQLKRPYKDGKITTAFYTQYGNKLELDPKASLSGTVSLSEETRKASGNATFTISNDDAKNQEFNQEDLLITVTDLNFSNVSYSDTDDLKKLMKK